MLATSDVPGGVVNLLTGSSPTPRRRLAWHMGVNGLDLAGFPVRRTGRALEQAAADASPASCVPRRRIRLDGRGRGSADPEFLETKTVWHPKGCRPVSGAPA